MKDCCPNIQTLYILCIWVEIYVQNVPQRTYFNIDTYIRRIPSLTLGLAIAEP